MRNFHSAFTSLRSSILCGGVALLLVACGNDDNNQDSAASGGNSTENASNASDGGTGNGGKGGAKEPGPEGANCEGADDCTSKICREITFPDIIGGKSATRKSCALCNTNAECTDQAVGTICGPVYRGALPHFRCQKGDLGDNCVEVAHCAQGKKCADTALGAKSCSDCESNADCSDPAKPSCAIVIEGGKYYRTCSAKLADGETCTGGENSDEECQNYCPRLKLSPLPVGVCSPCKEDSHCAENQKCIGPTLGGIGEDGMPTLNPGKCKDKPAGGGTSTPGDDTTTGDTTTGGTENTSSAETTAETTADTTST